MSAIFFCYHNSYNTTKIKGGITPRGPTLFLPFIKLARDGSLGPNYTLQVEFHYLLTFKIQKLEIAIVSSVAEKVTNLICLLGTPANGCLT